jgi:outer membrane protein assembly factor BamB
MRWTVAVVVTVLVLGRLAADDWPGWRGPTGQGVCAEKDLPLEWDAKTGKNVLWKVTLPGHDGKGRLDQNQSSPIVKKGTVFVTLSYWPAGVSEKKYPEHHVLCFDAVKGTQLWDVTVAPGPWLLRDLRGGYTVPTPAADDQRVYVAFGSSVIAALDHAGKQVWRKEIVPYDFDVAMASSPVLYRGLVILQLDGVARSSRMVACDAKSGDVKWTEKRPTCGFSHSTPVLVKLEGKWRLLVAASNAVQGVDPDDGKLLWWCAGSGDTVSPVLGKGLVYCDGGRGGPGVCVAPGGKGDVTRTQRKWKLDSVPGGFSSPVVVGDQLYRLTDPGVLRSWKMTTGEKVYEHRLQGVATAPSPFTTPDGRIYLASSGKSYVVKAGAKPVVLATNDLGDGGPASAAVANGRIYFKGRRYLWCVGKKE